MNFFLQKTNLLLNQFVPIFADGANNRPSGRLLRCHLRLPVRPIQSLNLFVCSKCTFRTGLSCLVLPAAQFPLSCPNCITPVRTCPGMPTGRGRIADIVDFFSVGAGVEAFPLFSQDHIVRSLLLMFAYIKSRTQSPASSSFRVYVILEASAG